MKVCIALDHRKRNINKTGKGFFAQRLMGAMKQKGVEFVSPEERADIDLGIGRWQYEPNAKKNILRLGAAHIDTNDDYDSHNIRKFKSVKMADGIIYQSGFSKTICDKFIGKTGNPISIIPNGSPIINPVPIEKSPYYRVDFLASTRDWIPQKNLRDIVVSFIEANNDNAYLWITGITHGIEKIYKHKNIKYLGVISQIDLMLLYELCEVMINIVYADACPNNVVESICSGCWILSSNSGGTKELIKEGENGNILPLYKNIYDYSVLDLSKPIKINRAYLVEAFKKQYKRHNINDYLDINLIADKYIEFFKEILG